MGLKNTPFPVIIHRRILIGKQMCIIGYNERGVDVDMSQLKIAYDNNPHGFGLLWYDNTKVRSIRGMFDFNEIRNLLSLVHGLPYAFHMRWRTRGDIGKDLCHPFQIRNHANSDDHVWMMHNGTLNVKVPSGHSDSSYFAQHLSSSVTSCGSKILFRKEVTKMMEKKVTTINKILFMNAQGDVNIVNKNVGCFIDGVWYSNSYSFTEGYRSSLKKRYVHKRKHKRNPFAKAKTGTGF